MKPAERGAGDEECESKPIPPKTTPLPLPFTGYWRPCKWGGAVTPLGKPGPWPLLVLPWGKRSCGWPK